MVLWKQGVAVIVDDVSVLAGSVAEMANHIRSSGGEVAGVVVIVKTGRDEAYGANPSHISLIEDRFGDEIRQKFGIEPEALTPAEAKYVANFRDADQLRTSIAAARRERISGLRAKGVLALPEQRPGVDPSRVAAPGLAPRLASAL